VGAAETADASRILETMVESMQVVTAICALLAGAGAVALVVARLLATRMPAAARLGRAAVAARSTLTLVVAGGATLGSLYFSEVADYIPCRLCWFQRVEMYPIAVVALVAVLRRDRNARWYMVPLAAIGICISTWHYLLEWNPTWESDACGLFGPACSVPWFRTFGFVSLALMALLAFAFIIVVNVISFGPSAAETASREETP
jgi:disulfide bond formation protein DsbB